MSVCIDHERGDPLCPLPLLCLSLPFDLVIFRLFFRLSLYIVYLGVQVVLVSEHGSAVKHEVAKLLSELHQLVVLAGEFLLRVDELVVQVAVLLQQLLFPRTLVQDIEQVIRLTPASRLVKL